MALSRALAVVLGAGSITPAYTGCANSMWTDAYSEERCHISGDAAVVQCLGKTGSQCGMRMESTFSSGVGSHSMGIKAAPGPGVVTTFYLSNNGGLYDKSCSSPWVELDYEIMGNQVGPQSKIWTNMFTGTCQEHSKWITVPFDVSAGYHTYAFNITDDTISWVVDGVAYRTESIADYSDVRGAAQSNSFGEFVSVWGKSSSEPAEGIPEFQNALGKLDYNAHTFPLFAGFKRGVSQGGVPAPAPPAPSPSTCSGGPTVWHGCQDSKCCSDGSTCFEKDAHYAQCRHSCVPGVHHDDDPEFRSPWSCRVVSPAARRLSLTLV